MLSDVIRCYPMLSDVIRCYPMLSDVIRCYPMFGDVRRCSTMFGDVRRCSAMFDDVRRYYPMFSDIIRCSAILSELQFTIVTHSLFNAVSKKLLINKTLLSTVIIAVCCFCGLFVNEAYINTLNKSPTQPVPAPSTLRTNA